MLTGKRLTIGLALLLTLGWQLAPAQEEDPFWEDEAFEDKEFMNGTGSGVGIFLSWLPVDLGDVNTELESVGLVPIPEKDIYWGAAGWFGLSTGGNIYVALGLGGFGGDTETVRGNQLSRWSLGALYFAVKGIYPAKRWLFLEGGVQLGGGSSDIWVEETDTDTGVIQVPVRGDRNFIMFRPQVGIDVRLARWVGILFEGGYTLTSGTWSLEGQRDLISELKFGDGNAPYVSVIVRFGI